METVKTLSDFSVGAFQDALVERGFKPSHAESLLRAYYESGDEGAWNQLLLPCGLVETLRDDFLSVFSSGLCDGLRFLRDDEDGL
jgi:hypothetical protein